MLRANEASLPAYRYEKPRYEYKEEEFAKEGNNLTRRHDGAIRPYVRIGVCRWNGDQIRAHRQYSVRLR